MSDNFALRSGEGICLVCGQEAVSRYRNGFGVVDVCSSHQSIAREAVDKIHLALGGNNPHILHTCVSRLAFKD